MDRLTRRLEDGEVQVNGECKIWELLDRLAEYEDTGYTPEKISTKTITNEETFGLQWHDVEKELPKRGEDCLCHVQYGLDRDCDDVVISQLGRYKRFSIEQNVEGVKVLHWMPIPPLPEEEIRENM